MDAIRDPGDLKMHLFGGRSASSALNSAVSPDQRVVAMARRLFGVSG
jgi:hypothetical protein